MGLKRVSLVLLASLLLWAPCFLRGRLSSFVITAAFSFMTNLAKCQLDCPTSMRYPSCRVCMSYGMFSNTLEMFEMVQAII